MKKKNGYREWLLMVTLSLLSIISQAQTATLRGRIRSQDQAVELASIHFKGKKLGTSADSLGWYVLKNVPAGTHTVIVSSLGYHTIQKTITLVDNESKELNFEMFSNSSKLHEVVVSGTMKEVSKLESPVPVEVYTAKFFKSNPTASIFEALQNINGVRPQINCNVCNTGDIHINGLDGPYTMVMIDGMPIVSGLSTVYGLFGIPQSLTERVEIVKGPSSTLYGSEAVGGLINIITKKATNTPLFSSEVFATSWGEINTDLAGKFNFSKKAQSLLGVNYFNYTLPIDKNKDGFTDMTLQNRISVFNKWNLDRKDHRSFSVAGRFIYEDRWGGEMNWSNQFRGGDSIYGESIYTKRWELFGTYQLPIKEKIIFQFSTNGHQQNSMYGKVSYIAQQYIGFGQLSWNKQIKNNTLLIGTALRFTYYDDNKIAPAKILLPGIFVQDEISMNEHNKLLLGIRFDNNSIHGNIFSPRINYKWSSINKNNIVRVSLGNGYRVANIFTEDHAALTGARQVKILSNLNPETSWNGNINLVKKIFTKNGKYIGIDATSFYTYFSNKIIADYVTDPNTIIYNNLEGHSISKGFSLNLDFVINKDIKLLIGGTYMDIYKVTKNVKEWQMFSERFTSTWNLEYSFRKRGITIDYTGNMYSPMRLPLISKTDPRTAFAPWWSIQNIQITKKIKNGVEVYGGIKNLLNWTPNKGNPFIIARANDPFDKEVSFDSNGQAMVTQNNPYGLTFDPSYVYGPNQGIRLFFGCRYSFTK